MALRDQPYIPFYVQDFLTDEKLTECSASATGIYIRIMCLMHKSEHYGKILLKQKHKQTGKQISDFAKVFAKVLPYPESEILLGLEELVSENVLILDGDFLIQKRMVRDNEISVSRSEAGKNGVIAKKEKNKKGKNFANTFAKAKHEANSENEYVNENESENTSGTEKKVELSFPYKSEKFMQTWQSLSLGKKWKKKTQSALQMNLNILSRHAETVAIEMMERSIAGDYQGIFELKNNYNGNTTNRNSTDLSLLGDNREPL